MKIPVKVMQVYFLNKMGFCQLRLYLHDPNEHSAVAKALDEFTCYQVEPQPFKALSFFSIFCPGIKKLMDANVRYRPSFEKIVAEKNACKTFGSQLKWLGSYLT